MSESDIQKIKRLKSSRACDQCRKLRTRCDENPLPLSSQHGSLDLSTLRERKCKRCTRLNIDCTFILPIAETRDRKRAASPIDISRDNNESPTGTASRPQYPLRKHSSVSSPSSILEPMEQFKQFLDTSMPIVNSKEISNNTSVLLTCCIRLLVASFTEPNNIGMREQIQSSIRMYFVQKQAITTPSMHNIQSLLLLSLFVDEPGTGNKLISAVRMAASMHWNIPPEPDTDRSAAINFIWWSLVSQDIWLYLYSGIPPVIHYMSFDVPKPNTPTFFSALTNISEILRMLMRQESLGEYSTFHSPFAALAHWEERFFAEVYSASPNAAGGYAFDANALLRILHSVVLAVFVLQDPFFHNAYNQHRSQQFSMLTPPAGTTVSAGYPSPPQLMQSLGYDQNYVAAGASYTSFSTNHILNLLLGTLRTQLQHQVLFSRWGYLQRFSEVCLLAILRVPVDTQDASAMQHQHYNYSMPPQNRLFEERNQVIQSWRSITRDERWAVISMLAERDGGWNIVLDLNDDDVEEDEEEPDLGESDPTIRV